MKDKYYDDEYEDEEENDEEYDEKPVRKKGKLNRIIFALAVIIVAVGTYIMCLGYEMYSRAVTTYPLEKMAEDIKTKENFTSIESIPKFYLNAVVATEDRRFYSHNGIDLRSIGRAILTNIREMRLAEGGSTISQQLAKNAYYSQEKSFIRKAAEMFTAFDIEKNFDKNEILELYVNNIYYGDNCYTICDASLHYFDKYPNEMNEWECSLLAGVPNAPSIYAPTANYDLCLERQKEVLSAMVDAGYITEEKSLEIQNSEKTILG